MSILKKIHEAIEVSRLADDFTISEDPGSLQISGAMPLSALSAWQSVIDEPCAWLTLECIDATHDRIAPRDGVSGERHRVNLKFTSPPTTPHLFTPEGWRILLHNDQAISSATSVRLAFIDIGFQTRAFEVEPWVDVPKTIECPRRNRKLDAGPRRQVRCHSPELMAPISLEPWINAGIAPDNGQAVEIWRDVAAQMIVRSLPNDLYREGEIFKVGLSGQPPRRLDLGLFRSNEIQFKILQEAATWLYLEGDDIDVRHTFLSAELAREWAPDVTFYAGLASRLPRALESARLVYKAHLRSGSKDTLKALADLRKVLSEEVQKLLQQSRDLSSAVWRDVAIAIGVLAVRFAMDGIRASQVTTEFGAIYCLVALYIGVSYAITVSTNNKFLAIVETSRRSWRTKLYSFLDDDDYKILADKPLGDAIAAYRTTQWITTLVVLVVVLALLAGATHEIKWSSYEPLVECLVNAIRIVGESLAGK